MTVITPQGIPLVSDRLAGVVITNGSVTVFTPQGAPLVSDRLAGVVITNGSVTVFTLQGIPLVSDSLAGVVITNGTLVLHQITRDASGDYTCSAENSEGSGTSHPVQLRVHCEYAIT